MSKAVFALAKRVDSRILFLRGQKIILDSDLAALYGVEVKHLNQQIKRNRKRFPGDRTRRNYGRNRPEFGARDSNEHFCSSSIRAHAPSAVHKSADCGEAGRS